MKGIALARPEILCSSMGLKTTIWQKTGGYHE